MCPTKTARRATELKLCPDCESEGVETFAVTSGYCVHHYRKRVGECDIEGCTRAARTDRMCQTHYKRFIATGSTEPDPTKICTFKGCKNLIATRGYCAKHDRLMNTNNGLADSCEGVDCPFPVHRAGLCQEHYRWWCSENQPRVKTDCLAKYDWLIRSANPTRASLGSPRIFPSPTDEIWAAFPIRVTPGRTIDQYVQRGLETLALTWFEKPPTQIGFQLGTSPQGPVLLARASKKKKAS